MLIVRRRAGQAILIGGQVEVHVLEIAPGRVKLGVLAPREIPVIRAEVRLTEQANLAAAQGMSPEKLAELATHLKAAPPGKARRAGGEADEGACTSNGEQHRQ